MVISKNKYIIAPLNIKCKHYFIISTEMSHKAPNTPHPSTRREFRAQVGPAMFDIIRNQLYTRKIESPIREYLTNAADIHTRMGKPTKDILITLPTLFNPCLTIKDQGSGMAPDEIQYRYVVYFSSDKGNREHETGSLGLGCKSAFAYSTEFTVISFHEGTRYVYKGYLDSSLMGRMDLLMANPTEEPNGMEISIPVPESDFTKFRKATWNVLKAFDEMPTVTNPPESEEPPTNYDFSKSLTVSNASSKDKHSVVMGNVAYTFTKGQILWRYAKIKDAKRLRRITNFLSNLSTSLVFKVPLGAVDYLPSREQLEFSAKTQRYLTRAIVKAYDTTCSSYQKNLDKCTTWEQLVELHGDTAMQITASASVSANWRGNAIRSAFLEYPADYSRLFLQAYADILGPATMSSGTHTHAANTGPGAKLAKCYLAPYPLRLLKQEVGTMSLQTEDPFVVFAVRGVKRFNALLADPTSTFTLWDTSKRALPSARAKGERNVALGFCLLRSSIERYPLENLDPNQPILACNTRHLILPRGGTLPPSGFHRQIPALNEIFSWAMGIPTNKVQVQGATKQGCVALSPKYTWDWLLTQIADRAPDITQTHILQSRGVARTLLPLLRQLSLQDIHDLPDHTLKHALLAWHLTTQVIPSTIFTSSADITCLESLFPSGKGAGYSSIYSSYNVRELFPHFPCQTRTSTKLSGDALAYYIKEEMNYIRLSKTIIKPGHALG
jgi:hypothetical protein